MKVYPYTVFGEIYRSPNLGRVQKFLLDDRLISTNTFKILKF